MKKDLLKRLAALLICGAMLLSGFGLADEMGGVDTEESAPAQTVTPPEVEEYTDAPESDGTPDSVLDAGSAAETGEQVEETGAAETGEQVEGTGAAETGEQVEADGAPEADEQIEDDGAGEGADDGLVEGSPDAVVYTSLNEDNGIVLAAAAPASCTNGHNFVDAAPQRKAVGIASRDANGHAMNYEVITGKVCSVCGLFDPDSYKASKEVGAVEQHDYKATPGTCSVCGYKCQHPGVEKTLSDVVTWNMYNSYEPISDTEHVHLGYKVVLFACGICGASSSEDESLETQTYRETEAHEWDESGTQCTECHFTKEQASCEHEWVDVPLGGGYADQYEPSAEGCIGRGVHKLYDHYCYKCEMYEVKETYDPAATIVLPHDFNEDGINSGTGVCSRCGYKPDCGHERKQILEVEQSDALSSGELHPNGNGTHSGKFVQRTRCRCIDCGYEWSETQVVEGIQPCEYRADGTCICGATNGGHEHKWSGKAEDIVRRYNISFPGSAPKDNGDGTHTFATYAYDYDYICSICGAVVTVEDATGTDYVEAHYIDEDIDGSFCQDCGIEITCTHEHVETRPEVDLLLAVARKDQEKHYVSYPAANFCTTCGARVYSDEVQEVETITVEEPHVWSSNGVCSICGEVRACTHERLHEATPVVKTVYKEIPGDDEMHQVIVSRTYTCPDCLVTVTEVEEPTEEPHDYGQGNAGGKCASEGCGHVCEHKQVNDEYIASDPYLEAGQDFVRFEDSENDAKHSIVRQPVYYCPCGKIVPYGPTVTVQEDHEYKDGVCITEIYGKVCGHVCQHTTKKLDTDKAVKKESDKFVSDNDDTHSKGYTLTTPWTCPCGKSGEEVTEHPTGDPIPHNYVKQGEDYVCTECGRKCTHSGVTPKVETAVEYPEAGISQQGHTPKTTTTTTLDCPHGHEKIVKTEVVDGASEAHAYDDKGVCTACKFACAHLQTVQEEEPRNIRYSSNGAQGHTVTYDLCNVTRCYYCGIETREPEVITAGVTATEEHSFAGNACALCGYVKPAPAATPKPAEPEQQPAVDEPAFQEVAPETPVHGVTADSNTRMGTALGTAVAEIEREYGASAQLSIQNAEKVLPEKEYVSFRALPAQEQIMVLVAVLSGESEAETGVNELGMTLSGDAEALIANLRDWMQGMTAEESAAFMELVKEYFTAEGEDDHLMITLEIKTESGTRLERYSFDLVDGAWVLSKLEVAGAE